MVEITIMVEKILVKKIVGDSADGGFLGMKFLSPLNEDLVMERSLSKSVLNVYM